MYKIFDSHTHIYPEEIAARATENLGNFYNFTVSESGTLNNLFDCQRKAQASGFLLLPVATSSRNVDKINELSAESREIARKNGFEAYAFGSMHRNYPDFKAGLEKCISLGIYGIKLHPDIQRENVDSEKMCLLYELMEERNFVLYLHVGDEREEFDFSSPERVALIAKTFPKLRIVAAHLGGYQDWEKAERALIGKYDNVFYDCSSTLWKMSAERAKYLIEKCGVDRVFFGSDYPVKDPETCLSEFLRLDFSEETREDILYNNFKREIVLKGGEI